MISLFSTGDFMRVSIKAGPSRDYLGAVGLLMGLIITSDAIKAVINGAEGVIGLAGLDDIESDFVYNVGRDSFEDRSNLPTDEVPEE